MNTIDMIEAFPTLFEAGEASEIYSAVQSAENMHNLEEIKEDAQLILDFLADGISLPKTGTHGSKKGRAAWLNNKITEDVIRWGDIFGDSVEDVCTNIINDDRGWLASRFAKDPAKQNLSERVHMAMLEYAGIEFEDLPNRGDDQVTFIGGEKRYGPIPSSEREYGQNCDFRIGNIYTTNKNTKGRGGLQEAQVKSVAHWLTEVIAYIDANPNATERFAAIVDGSTFTMTNNKHLNDLRALAEGYEDRIFIGSMKEFVDGDFHK